ncbi:MAG: AMP-dependent synthetase [Cyanobacteria bacterium RYN_339]|nr:AMP-dependent synthetase [Cyanobacteria bacterium RYN_339]
MSPTVLSRLAAIAAHQPDAPCLGDQGWQAFIDAVGLHAAALTADGGRVVVLDLPPGPAQVRVLLGAIAAGALPLPLPPGVPPFERECLLAGLDVARVLITEPVDPLPAGPQRPPGPALLLATSGSSGQPKRVALTESGLLWNAGAHADALALPAGVRTLVTSPLAHAFPLVAQVLATLLRGGSLAWPTGAFTPRGFMRQVAADGIGYAALAPALLRLLVERNPEAQDLPPILSVGAAPVAAAELSAWVAWAARGGCRLYHTYGLSEAGPRVATLDPEDVPAKAHTVGRPLPGLQVRVEAGELWISSPSVMAGYYPGLAGKAPDGWLPTGDLGHLDEDGFLVVSGRLKDMVVCGGVSIWAPELEDALAADPRVVEAAVVARPHAAYGEVPVAFVVGALTPEQALAGLTERLGRAKLPHQIVVLPALPRTALGKVDKRQLREAACEASR